MPNFELKGTAQEILTEFFEVTLLLCSSRPKKPTYPQYHQEGCCEQNKAVKMLCLIKSINSIRFSLFRKRALTRPDSCIFQRTLSIQSNISKDRMQQEKYGKMGNAY